MLKMNNSVAVNSDVRMIHIRLSADIHRRLRMHAAEHDLSIQKCVIAFIEKIVNKKEYIVLNKQQRREK